MAKSDLKARPVFHRTRDSIEAHLTVVFAALAVARLLQHQTGTTIKKIVQTLQPLRTIVVTVGDQELIAEPTIDDTTRDLIHAINAGHQKLWNSGQGLRYPVPPGCISVWNTSINTTTMSATPTTVSTTSTINPP
ncbi:hypothetical protein NGF75_05370 [Dietzia kunjamensis]|uniref:hypothetical protein n=1 Tax=Dietzia kunjamensis TaxID=322509 RepID=UPI002DC06517|nr:hypothetical protein [Dietzia kunjamensis]MEB8325419.1 hypothetical protein [Dietzia kunjamensis]